MTGPRSRAALVDGAPMVAATSGAMQDERWAELVGRIGVGIGAPLADALHHLDSLIVGGQVDPTRLHRLRAALEEARQVGITAQRLTRLASRQVRVSHETVRLDALLRDMLRQHADEARSCGLLLPDPFDTAIRHAELLVDATLLHALLGALFDWLLAHAVGPVKFRVEVKSWPQQARLHCRFVVRDQRELADDGPAALFGSLGWRLIEQIARTLDLVLDHRIEGTAVELVMEFPRPGDPAMAGIAGTDAHARSGEPGDAGPLLDRQLLVVASRRAQRLQIREAVAHLGVAVHLVSSVDEAADFCRAGLPDALVVDRILDGSAWEQLRNELRAASPDLAFIMISDEGGPFEMSDASDDRVAMVGRTALETALPAVLLFELSRGA